MQPTPRNEPAPTPHPTPRTVFTRQQQLIGWLAVFGPWAGRLLPIYLKPRADGRPG